MQSLVQTTAEKPTDTLTVHVYKGNRNNSFIYYEDDGESYNYENGTFYKRTITYDAVKKQIVFSKAEGSLTSKFKYIKVQLHGFADNDKIALNTKSANTKTEFVSFLTPVSSFDPQGVNNAAEGHNVKTITMSNSSNQMVLSY